MITLVYSYDCPATFCTRCMQSWMMVACRSIDHRLIKWQNEARIRIDTMSVFIAMLTTRNRFDFFAGFFASMNRHEGHLFERFFLVVFVQRNKTHCQGFLLSHIFNISLCDLSFGILSKFLRQLRSRF